jgi:hypothetical protein
MNILGLTAALTAFVSIWLGHVTVRKVEAQVHEIRIPIFIAIVLGLLIEYASLLTDNRPLSTALGIIGVTLLWDGLEIYRQQHRVQRGHAPANPNNPRHARFLAEAGSHATTQDLLKREPQDF